MKKLAYAATDSATAGTQGKRSTRSSSRRKAWQMEEPTAAYMKPAYNGTPATLVRACSGYAQEPMCTLNSSRPSPIRWKAKMTATSRAVSNPTR